MTGNKWQDGIGQIALQLGRDGRPLINALQECREKIPKPANRENRQITAARDGLDKILTEYEQKFGK